VGFNPDLTAIPNILLYSTIMGLKKADIEKKIPDILHYSELENFKDTKIKYYSSGMLVRLAFATAIQTNPKILLLDEVFAVGDIDFQNKSLKTLYEFKKKGITIVIVSHDLDLIRHYCDRALFLSNGEVIKIGSPNEIIDEYYYSNIKFDLHSYNQKKSDNPQIQEDLKKQAPDKVTNIPCGNKQIFIESIVFLDKNGNETFRFICRDPLKIIIKYFSKIDAEKITFGIGIYSIMGSHVFGTNTKLSNYNVPHIKKGLGSVEISIDSMTILSGNYYLSASIQSDDSLITYDWIDKGVSFQIIPHARAVGIIDIPLKWNIVDK
jgi:ABC-type multidrug transport system ATPase subunit